MPRDLYTIERRAWTMPNGCWLWMGGTASDGYGRTRREGRSIGTHQAAYVAHHGPVPPGQVVMHTCDNRWCVNPEHLVAGTIAENNLAVWRRGGRVAKLSANDAEAIRTSNEPQRVVARQYGVAQSTISRVRSGEYHAMGTGISPR